MIINLTQHKASAEQLAVGVIDVSSSLTELLTFSNIPSMEDMQERAHALASIATISGCKSAMIGGAPYFMSTLEKALLAAGVTPLYAFSVRSSVEVDGVKTSVFQHAGFVEVN